MIKLVLISVIVLLLAICMYYISGLKKKMKYNQYVLDMSLKLNNTVNRRELLQLIMTNTNTILDAEASSIILMDQETGELYFEVATGEDSEHIKRIKIAAGQGVAGWVQMNGEAVLINDVTKDSRWNRTVSDSSSLKTRNMLCAPILSNGALLGVIQVINKKNSKGFKQEDLNLLEELSSPIAMSLENMMLYEALRHSMDSLQRTTATKEKMLSEMRLAKDIQLSLLPGTQFHHHRIAIEATLLPAQEVGGDFYHFFNLDEEHILICLGDVSDKGMPAALFMSALMIWIKAKASPTIPVHEIVQNINDELSTDSSTMFATLFIAIINTVDGVMSYCDAGHCSAYVIGEAGQLQKLDSYKNLPIGVMPGNMYHSSSYQFSPHEQLVIYTDGITEAENSNGEWFGEERLEQYINQNQHQLTPSNMIEQIKTFSTEQQSDDIAIMIVKVN